MIIGLYLSLFLLSANALNFPSQLSQAPFKPEANLVMTPTPDTSNCTLNYYGTHIDHFDPSNNSTYKMRYFSYDKYFKPGEGPIFFYLGNEADVTLYVNATGLMWENAEKYGALLIFAEHRYYGDSIPSKDLRWLTHEQALADYATLIHHLRKSYQAPETAVIGFGGSYGGMLAAWARMKYPQAFDGVIAASAPILAFNYNERANMKLAGPESYWKIVSDCTTPLFGSAAGCSDNIRQAWPIFFKRGKTSQGRAELSSIFKLCEPLESEEEVFELAVFIMMAWDTMAMGNFPYPSSYLTNGGPLLPSYPVRAACEALKGDISDETELLSRLGEGAGVYNNATKDLTCYELPSDKDYDGIWDYQWLHLLIYIYIYTSMLFDTIICSLLISYMFGFIFACVIFYISGLFLHVLNITTSQVQPSVASRKLLRSRWHQRCVLAF